MPSMPGTRYIHIWSTEGMPTVPHDGSDDVFAFHPFNVQPGGTRFSLSRLPAKAELDAAAGGSYEEDPQSIRADYRAHYGVIARGDEIAYAVVLDGRPAVRVGDEVVRLDRGDVVVNTGAPYHWENPGDVAAWIAFVRIGAERQ